MQTKTSSEHNKHTRMCHRKMFKQVLTHFLLQKRNLEIIKQYYLCVSIVLGGQNRIEVNALRFREQQVLRHGLLHKSSFLREDGLAMTLADLDVTIFRHAGEDRNEHK